MKLWLTGNGYVENTKNMKKYRNVRTNVEIFGENTKTFGERGKKKMAAPMELPKTGNSYAELPNISSNSQIFHKIPEIFHQISKNFTKSPRYFGKMLKCLVKIRNIW